MTRPPTLSLRASRCPSGSARPETFPDPHIQLCFQTGAEHMLDFGPGPFCNVVERRRSVPRLLIQE